MSKSAGVLPPPVQLSAGSGGDAIAALEAASPATDVAGASSSAQPGNAPNAASDASSSSAPATSAPPKRGRGRPPGSKNGARVSRGDEYRALKNEQLRALVAKQEKDLEELRGKVKAQEISQLEDADEAMRELGEIAADGAFNVGAYFWGPHVKLDLEQKKELGRLWARAAKPYMAEHIQDAPLGAAILYTVGVVAQKAMAHKIAKLQPAAPGSANAE